MMRPRERKCRFVLYHWIRAASQPASQPASRPPFFHLIQNAGESVIQWDSEAAKENLALLLYKLLKKDKLHGLACFLACLWMGCPPVCPSVWKWGRGRSRWATNKEGRRVAALLCSGAGLQISTWPRSNVWKCAARREKNDKDMGLFYNYKDCIKSNLHACARAPHLSWQLFCPLFLLGLG